MAGIYVISGFLGAGKTTLVEKLLSESFQNKKVAVIENDFGEKSIDARLLASAGYSVTELNSGCICCSIRGDFQNSICSIVKTHHPDVLLIEPSGVGKLSDIEQACKADKVANLAHIEKKITVVDSKNCKKYFNNFGEFFDDQIKNTDLVLFSKTLGNERHKEEDLAIVQSICPTVPVRWCDWDDLNGSNIVGPNVAPEGDAELTERSEGCCHCGCDHHDHEHEHENCHCHTAEEAFQSISVTFPGLVDLESIKAEIENLSRERTGEILRAKGIVRGLDSYYTIQYVPGELKIQKTEIKANELCIIGKDLNEEKIRQAFALI